MTEEATQYEQNFTPEGYRHFRETYGANITRKEVVTEGRENESVLNVVDASGENIMACSVWALRVQHQNPEDKKTDLQLIFESDLADDDHHKKMLAGYALLALLEERAKREEAAKKEPVTIDADPGDESPQSD